MKYFLLFIFLFMDISASTIKSNMSVYDAVMAPRNMSTSEKKKRFYAMVVPAVKRVHADLMSQYESVKSDIQNSKNRENIERLKKLYKVESDEELLLALKPHPKSIVLAQAAMESAWGTSRFFTKANNVFGVWSINKNEPRIAASEKRGGKKTIWLRKFETIEESVKKYYKMIATAKAYKEFRELRATSSDVHELVKKLDKYSEIGERYGEELSKVIKYNKMTKYD